MSERFPVIDCGGASLFSVELPDVRLSRAVLLRNHAQVTPAAYHEYVAKLGFPLPYGDGVELVFEGETLKEDDLHYDGISSVDPKRVPAYVAFYVERALGPGVGGEFTIVDCARAVELIPNDLREFLRSHKEQFFGYPLYNKSQPKPDELTFEVDSITSFDGVERLRIHLPFSAASAKITADGRRVHSRAHDFSLAFSGCDGRETLEIFDEVRKIVVREDVMWTIEFQDGDILIIDNEFVFHGRHGLTRPTHRVMRRVQLLAEPYEQ